MSPCAKNLYGLNPPLAHFSSDQGCVKEKLYAMFLQQTAHRQLNGRLRGSQRASNNFCRVQFLKLLNQRPRHRIVLLGLQRRYARKNRAAGENSYAARPRILLNQENTAPLSSSTKSRSKTARPSANDNDIVSISSLHTSNTQIANRLQS